MVVFWSFDRQPPTAAVRDPERPGFRQAGADLGLGERPPRLQVLRHGIAGDRGLDDALRKDAHLGDGNERDAHGAFAEPAEGVVKPHRQREHERAPADDARHAPHGFGQRHLLGTRDGDGLPRQAPVDQRGAEERDEVLDGERAHGLFPEADKAEDREGVKRVAEVVEHVVAAAVDHAGLEDRVVEAGGAHDFLRGELRFMVAGAAGRAGAQEAHEGDLARAGAAGGIDHALRPADMDAVVRLRAALEIDAGAMRDRIAAGQRGGQLVLVVGAGRVKRGVGQFAKRRIALIDPARDDDAVMTLAREETGEVPADKSGSTGDGNFHREFRLFSYFCHDRNNGRSAASVKRLGSWFGARRESAASRDLKAAARCGTLGLMNLLAEHYRFTVDKFVRMAEQGFFATAQRVELLDGEIRILHPVDYRHAHAVTALSSEFAELARRRYSTSPQNPVELEKYSAPQPDICLVSRACRKSKRHPLPDQVYLMVEVSDTSLEYDRGPKMSAYALCGIREFWILNLQDDVLEIYRNPRGGSYLEQVIVRADGQAAPQAFPDVVIDLAEIIPER